MEEDKGNVEKEFKDAEDKMQICDYVRFITHDLNGIPRGTMLSRRRAIECLRVGMPFYSGINGFGPSNTLVFPPKVVAANLGNGILRPDPSSFHYTSWIGDERFTTGQIFADMAWGNNTPQEASSRHILGVQINRLKELGYSLLSGMEVECVITDKETNQPLFPGCDYGTALVFADYDSWFIDVDQAMTKAGVSLHAMGPEYGPGQFEFSTVPELGMKGIDHSALLKQAIREMASKRGWNASFLAKNAGCPTGSGGHYSFSLWNLETKTNVFYDEDAPDCLSTIARYWIGGIIKHAAALTAFCCSTTNCYQRLHGPWTPHLANWGLEDRNCMLRVKNKGMTHTYMENRIPSALANPYLLAAATLAAGLDGIKKRIPCPEIGDIETAAVMPRSLEEALDALQKDEAMVEALGQGFVEWYVLVKHSADMKDVSGEEGSVERLESETKVYMRLC